MDVLNFRVSPDSKSLEVWVEVPDSPAYNGINPEDGVYHESFDIKIIKAAIIPHNKYVSDTLYPIKTDNFELYELTITDPKKIVQRISLNDLGLLSINRTGMYYLYVQTTSLAYPDIPCCCFKDLTVACAINHYPIYNLMLKIINKYQDRCLNAQDKLLDLYLKKQMITDAISMCDYITANKIFTELYFREIVKGECYDGCGYNGGCCNESAIRNADNSRQCLTCK